MKKLLQPGNLYVPLTRKTGNFYEVQLESSGHSREYKRVATREVDFVLGLDLKCPPKVRRLR